MMACRAVIPTRTDQRVSPRFARRACQRRNIVDRLGWWLEERRRLATRLKKRAVNVLATVTLAMLLRCLRVLDSPDKAA
jgi:hypothetical protein